MEAIGESMIYQVSNDLLNSIRQKIDKEYITAKSNVEDRSDNIKISPKRETDTLYATASLSIRNEDTIYVRLGLGNYFDIDVDGGNYYRDHILEILETCIYGRVKEVVVRKSGKISRSTIWLENDSGQKKRFTYRDGLISFGGQKQTFDYKPYPKDNNPRRK